MISLKQAEFRIAGTTPKIFELHQDHFQVPTSLSQSAIGGTDGGHKYHVNTSRYLMSFISFGDRKLLEPKEPFSGPLYRPHGRFPRPYPTTSPTRLVVVKCSVATFPLQASQRSAPSNRWRPDKFYPTPWFYCWYFSQILKITVI